MQNRFLSPILEECLFNNHSAHEGHEEGLQKVRLLFPADFGLVAVAVNNFVSFVRFVVIIFFTQNGDNEWPGTLSAM